jgi:hypothetical protein
MGTDKMNQTRTKKPPKHIESQAPCRLTPWLLNLDFDGVSALHSLLRTLRCSASRRRG